MVLGLNLQSVASRGDNSVLDTVLRRIANIPVLPEARAALHLMVERDWNADESIEDRRRCESVFRAIYGELGGQGQSFEPFLTAWLILRAALLRLDHLQDNDISELVLPRDELSIAEQYNLVFAYYVLAMALIDDLDETAVPTRRIRYLARLWNDTMLWAASGQQRDLGRSGPTEPQEAVFSHYQETIQAKAGAVYGLGLGGVAALATDDHRVVRAISAVGQIYGALLQFSDDLLDASSQANPDLTLPEVYRKAAALSGIIGQAEHLNYYWAYIYRTYLNQVEETIKDLSEEVQLALLELFHNTFDIHLKG